MKYIVLEEDDAVHEFDRSPLLDDLEDIMRRNLSEGQTLRVYQLSATYEVQLSLEKKQ